MSNQLEQEKQRTCLDVDMPFHIRVAAGCGLCAGSLTATAIWYWLLDLGRIGAALRLWTLQTIVIAVPGIVVTALITILSLVILRAKNK